MPSKLKKAIAAVKDQTSISLAKVGGAESSSLEVAILRATTHDEVPVDERHITEVLQHVSSNRTYAGSCARAIGRRVGRTRSWVVAIKSLMLVLRILQDGDPHFPKEVLHAMKRGYKILNLSSFRDDSSTSCPWDFTAFVRTFSLYLDERLDCFVTGKLQRRRTYHPMGGTNNNNNNRGYAGRKNEPVVRDMKPAMLLDRISHWQRLLDRAIATRPTGAARSNRLVQTCLYAIVQETFELYRDISDGLALLLDSFFHLQYNNCVSAFQTCVKASKQIEELNSFYDVCKTIGIGRTSEYPSVQKVSDELLDTLQEFLKDQSSFPATNGRTSAAQLALPVPLSPQASEPGSMMHSGRSMSEFSGSQCTSLEDLIGGDVGYSPERYSDPGGENSPQIEDMYNAHDTTSIRSDPTDNRGVNSMLDLLSLDDPSTPPELPVHGQESGNQEESSTSGQGWELALFESPPNNQNPEPVTEQYHESGFQADFFSGFSVGNTSVSTTSASWLSPEQNYNPFLQDTVNLSTAPNRSTSAVSDDLYGAISQPSVSGQYSQDSFSSAGFPADLGLGIVDNNVPPTLHAHLGSTSSRGMDNFTTGFPPVIGNANANNNANPDLNSFSDSFPAEPSFPADFGSSNINQNNDFSDLFSDFGPSNPSVSTAFPGDLGSTNTPAVPPTFMNNANSANGQTHYQTDFGNRDVSMDFSDNFGGVTPTFSANSGEPTANAMNAIVPFGHTAEDELFSSGPRFQATPTFRATSYEVDQQNDLHAENDPFESFSANQHSLGQENVMQQQQLWLQNQNKIMARHLT